MEFTWKTLERLLGKKFVILGDIILMHSHAFPPKLHDDICSLLKN